MADVAALAGVSGQTVSRVANNRTNVDAITRAKVRAAMRELGYRPNGAARALRSGEFRGIGVIVFELATFGTTRALDAIATAATERGYSVNLMPVLDINQRAVNDAFNQLSAQAVDGVIILIEAYLLDEAGVQLPHGLPVVIVDSSAHYDYPVVDTDQFDGARQAVQHLLDLGHHTVHHVGGPRTSYPAAHRRRGWEQTLAGHGRPIPPVLYGDWTARAGYEAGCTLAEDPAVTAIFAANDQMALGVLRALHENNRAVPKQVSVVGFDDMEESAHFWPPLTTVRQSFADLGRHSVESLLIALKNGDPPPIAVPTELVIRASTAAARPAEEGPAGGDGSRSDGDQY
jgi:DNA-binding LacI/PurR family transcriptional regulator